MGYQALLVHAALERPAEPVWIDGYKDLQHHVGGTFDAIACVLGPKEVRHHVTCWVNDEAIYEELATNLLGSVMCDRQILGPVVVTGPADAEGRTLSLDVAPMTSIQVARDRLANMILGGPNVRA